MTNGTRFIKSIKLLAAIFTLTLFFGMPHTRFLEDGLIELRIKGKEGIARGFYCTLVDKRIVMLHIIIKKTNRIPKKELLIAKRRMNEVIKK
ncbi:MAG: type II toxin-antitoxin system RelE/ParE family toxin [Bacteroidetes bacterium]|nr:type II toxin-antitoxin system RelE/ParE family toxin [Bacteroidota bacterium]